MASKIMAPSSKRRKTDQVVATCLGDLPVGILEHAASFLAAPSRAFFSVALTTDYDPPSDNSSITGNDWDTLDFGEIEEELAMRLSDNDLSNVLQHIDAVNNVKRLRLTNCINITGSCLESLRGSKVVEKIDLSLTDDGESPVLDPDPPISSELVLPVLDSIVAAERCGLKHVQFPHKFRTGTGRSTDSDFHAFILRYNEMRDNRDSIACLNCGDNIHQDSMGWINTCIGREYYATHNHICYQCTRQYCYSCSDEEEDDEVILRYCKSCQRDYCKECRRVKECGLCKDESCERCSRECNECNKTICIECIRREDCYSCSHCGVAYCISCNTMELGADVFVKYNCKECDKSCCNFCRLRKYQEGGSDICAECIKLLPHEVALVEQSRRLQEDVKQLQKENGELKDVNKELQDEIKVLNDKIKSMAVQGPGI
jgi:FtsZ-binding cell division protein ZapB